MAFPYIAFHSVLPRTENRKQTPNCISRTDWGCRCQASRQGSSEGRGCARGGDQGGGGTSGGAAAGAVGGEEACSEEVAEGARRRGCLWPACRVWSVYAWLPLTNVAGFPLASSSKHVSFQLPDACWQDVAFADGGLDESSDDSF